MRVLAIVYCLLFSSAAFSQAAIRLGAGVDTLDLKQHIELLVDQSGTLTIDDVSSNPDAFVPVKFPFNGGYTSDVHWFRFVLQREQGAAIEWLLTATPAYLDHIRLFSPSEHGYQQDEVGELIATASRPLAETLTPFSMKVRLDDTLSHTFYLRLQTGSTSVMQLNLATPSALALANTQKKMMSGVVVGCLLMVAVYSLLMTTWSQQRLLYLSIFGYVFGSLLHRIANDGIAHQYLFPHNPLLVDPMGSVATCVMIAFADLFFMLFYSTKQNFPFSDRVFKIILLISLITFIGIFAGVYVTLAPVLLGSVLVVGLPFAVYTVWMGQKKGMIGTRYITYGFVLYILPNIVNMLASTGVIPSIPLFINVPQSASIVFVLFMYGALAERRRASELTRQEAEVKIKIAQKMAESEKKRREEQSQFMTLVTHELKTPLTVIDSAIQTLSLQKEDIDPIIAERHARIKTSISELNSLINNTLISENTDIAALKPRLSRIDCKALITQLIARLPDGLRRCRFTLPNGLGCTADQSLLELVISNLLVNAMKYSPADAPVSIAAEAVTRGDISGTQITVSNAYVAETMPDTTRWFQKYYRQSDTPDIQGFGLGLYLVKEIIQAHAGFIDCQVDGLHSPWQITFALWLPDGEAEQDV